MMRRYPRQPWLYDASDLVPQGDPETVICLPSGENIEGLRILGVRDDVMIGIKVDAWGAVVSCAVTNEIQIEHVPMQSNPRRQADGDSGDGA